MLELAFLKAAAVLVSAAGRTEPLLASAISLEPRSCMSFSETRVVGPGEYSTTLPLASGKISSRLIVDRPQVSTIERLFIFLPLVMWVAAAVVSWWMVHRYLIRPLRRLQQALEDAAEGNFSFRISHRRRDEFGATFDAFNHAAAPEDAIFRSA